MYAILYPSSFDVPSVDVHEVESTAVVIIAVGVVYTSIPSFCP